MEYVRLGKTNLRVSRIGFGCAPMSGYDYGVIDEAEVIDAVRHALDLGINFFDTADVYGFGAAEKMLSKALGTDRNNVVIATKCGLVWDKEGRIRRDCSPRRILKAVDDSLFRLKIDSIPLYQIHWVDPCVPLQQTIEALLECQKKGKIQNIGLCNTDNIMIEKAAVPGNIVTVQSSYNLMNRSAEQNILQCCHNLNISFISHSSLARGFLTGKYRVGNKFEGRDTRNKSSYFDLNMEEEKNQLLNEIKRISKINKKTIVQIALRWILENDLIAGLIVGIKRVHQLKECLGSIDWKLSDHDYFTLARYTDIFRDARLY